MGGKADILIRGILQRCSTHHAATCAAACCFPLQLEGAETIKLPSFKLETSPPTLPPHPSLRVLPFQLSCITSSICRHPSYFKHSGVLRWKHARNLDDWPSTPPPSTPTIPALCYLLRGRRGRRRPGCLDEVITAYQ